MTTSATPESRQEAGFAAAVASAPPSCEDCLGSGGWLRYEPALDPAPGMLYLSCLQCRGSGRLQLARD